MILIQLNFYFHVFRLYHIAQKKNFNYFEFTFIELYEMLCLLKIF